MVLLLSSISFAGEHKRYDPAERLGFKPRDKLAVQWLPEPYPVPGAEAEDGAGMRKYTERIRGTGFGYDDLAFDMVPIPGGKFLMGSPADEDNRNDDEGPQAEVEIEPFWMAACEVTWEHYDMWAQDLEIGRRKQAPTEKDWLPDAVSRPTLPYMPMNFDMGHDGYPAICMTQYAAKVYCKWLCAKTGRYYRLPTEAEWEYACRAGTTTAYSFGDDPGQLDDYAWWFDNSPDGYHKVGRKKPNPWGLYDVHGNVAEWVLDQHVRDYYRQRADGKVDGPFAVPTTEYPRVVRGGSWDDDPEQLRSAARRGSNEKWKLGDPQLPQSIWYHTDALFLGFRVVRPLELPTAEEAKLYEPDPRVEQEYNLAKGVAP
jgi:formylglycine-generating enzyme required for sulfatase activity